MKELLKNYFKFSKAVFTFIGVIITLIGSFITWKDYVANNNCATEELAPEMIHIALYPLIVIGAIGIGGIILLSFGYLIFLLLDTKPVSDITDIIESKAIWVKSKTLDKIPKKVQEQISNGFDWSLIIAGGISVILFIIIICILLYKSFGAIVWLVNHDFCL